MNRLEQLFEKLGYTRENGLFYIGESDQWLDKFPFRISKVLKDIIQPYAFYSIHHNADISANHPEPINNPLILFFDQPDEATRKQIPRWTFCFGQAPIIIINNGDFDPIDICHGYSFDSNNNEFLKKIETDISDFSLKNLSLGNTWKSLYHRYFKKSPKVDKFLLNNIVDARRILIAKDGLKLEPKAANRLIGRLLFIRYLIDRRVVFNNQDYITGADKSARQESLNQIILDKEKLYSLFDYLTDKYDGDLFPLTETNTNHGNDNVLETYNERNIVETAHLEVLHHLFSCSDFFRVGGTHNGYIVQQSLFKIYDFEVIPVELISNIYENFIGKKEENDIVKLASIQKSKQYEIKAYYTPPFLVDYILSQTVTPFLNKNNTASCKILDPACGSGIFLVESLRKIVEKHIQIESSKFKGEEYLIDNQTLWGLLRENIFGIDIDDDAIEVTIFSLYITLLDYKTPIEIEDFKFEQLKGVNLFGGPNADFFNVNASFNVRFQNDIKLDFILGNPPWGKVVQSNYIKYIKDRRSFEAFKNIKDVRTPLEIGNKEIAQAFLIRVSDIIQNSHATKCALIVTGKCLYNSDYTAKNWRKYFLSNFHIKQVVELSSVNNKIVGGHQIFEAARQPTAIIFYSPAAPQEYTGNNLITHISVKPNRFFNYFRTIVIEKHDVKKILQRFFNSQDDGYDWLWKVLLHGNTLDFYFLKRIKENYPSFEKIIKDQKFLYKGGLKITDGAKKKNTDKIKTYHYLDVDSRKEFQPYSLNMKHTWGDEVRLLSDTNKVNKAKIDVEGNVGYLPELKYFEGPKALLKKGLKAADDFRAVAAYTDENIVFTSSVFSIVPEDITQASEYSLMVLKILPAFFNSKLFIYFTLSSSSSAGVDRTRIYFDEFLAFPIALHPKYIAKVSEIVDSLHTLNKEKLALINSEDIFIDEEAIRYKTHQCVALSSEIDVLLYKCYGIDDAEIALIDYAVNIALPVLKRGEETGYKGSNIFSPLKIGTKKDKAFLISYASIFINHFKQLFNSKDRFFRVEIHVTNDYIGCHFLVDMQAIGIERISFPESTEQALMEIIGNLSIYQISRDLYIQQDVRGFNKTSFYVIKPNERKAWHAAIAHHDLLEFIEALTNSEPQKVGTL